MQVVIQANEYDLWQHKTNENIMRYSNRYKLSYKILFKDLGREDYQTWVILIKPNPIKIIFFAVTFRLKDQTQTGGQMAHRVLKALYLRNQRSD